MEDKPDGYYIPIHKSLVDPILIGGIDRNLCLGIWSVGVAIGVMLKMYWFSFLSLVYMCLSVMPLSVIRIILKP